MQYHFVTGSFYVLENPVGSLLFEMDAIKALFEMMSSLSVLLSTSLPHAGSSEGTQGCVHQRMFGLAWQPNGQVRGLPQHVVCLIHAVSHKDSVKVTLAGTAPWLKLLYRQLTQGRRPGSVRCLLAFQSL